MISNQEIRANSREQLGGGIFSNTWLIMVVVFLLYGAVMGASSATLVVAILVGGPLSYGICRMMIGLVNGKKNNFNDLTAGFTESFVNSLVLALLQMVFIMLWSLLLVVPGIVKSYSYAMAMYIHQDNPSKEANECITQSREMMNGYKWRLFCLDLSFIGWYILGALCFGIGEMFVIPYHQMARTNFYLALKAEKEGGYFVG